MESECFQTYKSLLREVTKGMEQVKQLGASSSNNKGTVLEKMLASYEEALSILQGTVPEGQSQSVMKSLSDPHSSASDYRVTQSKDSSWVFKKRNFSEINVTSDDLPELPNDRCSLRKDGQIDVPLSKKSRTPIWTRKIAVCSEASLDDGYSWRKYGQKDILGEKYPRSYFRCDKTLDSGCLATKQVQRSCDDRKFLVTYRGMHTCPTTKPIPEDKAYGSTTRKIFEP